MKRLGCIFAIIALIIGICSPPSAQPNKSSIQIELSSPNEPDVTLLRIIQAARTADTSIWLGPMVPPYMSCRVYSSVNAFGVMSFMYRIIAEVAIDTLDPIRYDSTTRITADNGPNLQSLTINNATWIRFIARVDGGSSPDSAQGSFAVTFDDNPSNLTGR